LSSDIALPDSGVAAKPFWSCVEVLLAVAIVVAGLKLEVVAFMFGSAPWLAAIGALSLWWRGPKPWSSERSRTSSLRRVVVIGIGVGVVYQLVGTFAVEPILARLTSGQLPDVSGFRSIVGNETQLAYWIALSWSLAAFVEEIAYRGWVLTRCAEVGRFSKGAWVGGTLASSGLFGAVHAYQGLSGVFATALTGLVFAVVYFVTGRSLWATILSHGVLNTTGFVMMYFGVYPGI
jgi:membrane protease YdiL (CAAX protease family)